MLGEFKRYLFEYRHDGSEWGIEVIATSPTDARERLKALTWARYQGEIKASVSIPSSLPQKVAIMLSRVIAFFRFG